MPQVLLSIGSNLGDRIAACRRAVAELDGEDGIAVVRVSGLYETEPVGKTDQPAFINLAVAIETSLDPPDLLVIAKAIEDRLGRTPGERWGPRVVDIDILLMGHLVHESASLSIPHERVHERRFVLAPLAEIAPDAVHPRLGRTVAELLGELGDRGGGVRKLPETV